MGGKGEIVRRHNEKEGRGVTGVPSFCDLNVRMRRYRNLRIILYQ